MKSFNYHQTTKIIFGRGKISILPEEVLKYGNRALLVTTPAANQDLDRLYNKIKTILKDGGIVFEHFSGVTPNPTTDCIKEGSKLARSFNADVIIGLGGGSSIDTAKAISVEATHEGSAWDYLFFKEPQPDPDKLLPVIAITTTSGTGSHVTQVSVMTNTAERNKSALYNNILYPQVAIVDPDLTLTVPEYVTACTGFDVLCHAFESVLHPGRGAYTNLLAWEAIKIVTSTLPSLLVDLQNISLREKMAWADTLAGLCIANAGVTLPHGIGMAIGGMYPQIAHGQALAIVYPYFAEFTAPVAFEAFSKLAYCINPDYKGTFDEASIKKTIENFLEKIGLNKKLSEFGMPESEIEMLAKQSMVLPDYKANPRVANDEEMLEIIRMCHL